MAMGDSLTAGLNSRVTLPPPVANKLIPSSQSSTEFRGASWISGGDPDSTSVGKILSFYNPSLSGLSRGNSSFLYCYGPICPAGKKFPYEPATMVTLSTYYRDLMLLSRDRGLVCIIRLISWDILINITRLSFQSL
jgi:hypothetical protein